MSLHYFLLLYVNLQSSQNLKIKKKDLDLNQMQSSIFRQSGKLNLDWTSDSTKKYCVRCETAVWLCKEKQS